MIQVVEPLLPELFSETHTDTDKEQSTSSLLKVFTLVNTSMLVLRVLSNYFNY